MTLLREWWSRRTHAVRVALAWSVAGGVVAVIVVAMLLMGGGEKEPPVVVTPVTRTPTAVARVSATPNGDARLPTLTLLAELTSKVGDPPDATRGRFRIPALSVDAPLGARGVDASGRMPLPAGPADVVMYDFVPQWAGQYGGTLGGGAGNVLFSGHLDYAANLPYAPLRYEGAGVFAGIERLNADDIIEVTTGGRTLTYVVQWRRTVAASTGAWAGILGRNVGGEAITLITCAGSFNVQTLEYDARVVVRALRAT